MKKNPWTGALFDAAEDFRGLLSKGYPEKASLKLVGDHFALDTVQRMILFRGVSGRASAAARKARLVRSVAGLACAVDGYNVLFSIQNYLLGRPLFIADDGVVRDAGGSYGRVANQGIFEKAMLLFADGLTATGAASVSVFLDSPVSHSGQHREELESLLRERLPSAVSVVKSADFMLVSLGSGNKLSAAIATSDSAVIDRSGGPVFDLSRFIIERAFSNRWERLFPESRDLH